MSHEIINGAVKFMEQDFVAHKKLFEELGHYQDPHTLFIGCSDSRVVPSLITSTFPGELFVVRNVANIVPRYHASQEYLATTSAIEYAICALNIENIVVCGHSNCGGCHAIYDPEKLAKLPAVANWLAQLDDIKHEILAHGIPEGEREWVTERVNIISSLENLRSYPTVGERLANEELRIYGWHYVIETGEVFIYDEESGHFKLAKK